MKDSLKGSIAALAALSLAGCGGSDGPIASAPAVPIVPPPAPPPADDLLVELLDHPQSQEFVAFAAGDPIRIRYDQARDSYEVKIADRDWLRVIDNPDSPSTPNTEFRIATDQAEATRFSTYGHYRYRHQPSVFRYSNLANWYLGPEGRQHSGTIAFGVPTSVGHVPITGSANYAGMAEGIANMPNTAWGGTLPSTPVAGQVNLAFDFSTGSLAGSLRLFNSCDCDKPIDLQALTFANAAIVSGSASFSGRFQTGASGVNGFSGLFTGPNAEELIGRWTVPFNSDGMTYSASGAWIAKRGN